MHCREYLLRFIRLTQRRDFQPWRFSWPGQHQPLHSILVLIAELNAQPHHDLAPATREFIDLALSMCCEDGLSGGIVSHEIGEQDSRQLSHSGLQSWAFIRQARDKCWKLAGLDPSILYLPTSFESIGIPRLSDEFEPDPCLADGIASDDMWEMFPQTDMD